MAGSVNKVILIGNLGKDPDIRTTQSGSQVASFSIATSESWKDKTTGERVENTQWHKVVVFNDRLIGLIERFVRKGVKVFIEGQLETRKWSEDEGRDHYVTEIVLRKYKGSLTLLERVEPDNEFGGSNQGGSEAETTRYQSQGSYGPDGRYQSDPSTSDVLDDDIPY